MKTEYKIVKHHYLDTFVKEVQNNLDNGWILQGGPSTFENERGIDFFMQAMIKNIAIDEK